MTAWQRSRMLQGKCPPVCPKKASWILTIQMSKLIPPTSYLLQLQKTPTKAMRATFLLLFSEVQIGQFSLEKGSAKRFPSDELAAVQSFISSRDDAKVFLLVPS
eukprot:Pompholyxophrys_punicea_v1_NODE_33_length_4967_cov_78.437093.p1 type:complete len:104 gc:universal NODE_33_length_4967_cov_78.437093:2221-2532(+)